MNAEDAYWNQEEHPDLVVVACVCGRLHLNDPLASPTLCPNCAMEEANGS